MSDIFGYNFFPPSDLGDLLAEGEADFKIIAAIVRQSKIKTNPHTGEITGGNPMMELKLRVNDKAGKEGIVMEYLVATPGDEKGMKRLATKIMNIGKSINNPAIYGEKAALVSQDLLGYKGKCIIKTQAGTGEFSDKSIISKYLPSEELLSTEREQLAQEQIAQLDDDLPWK